eukprot:5425210-Amphidinium_carterae.1
MIENQAGDGPICLRHDPDLLFYRINQNRTMTAQMDERVLGFLEPLATAVKFWAGIPSRAIEAKDLSEVKSFCESMEGGDPATSLFGPVQLQLATKAAPPPTLTQQGPM